MGVFGKRANAHGKRQDALASHVLNWKTWELTQGFCWEIFIKRTGCGDAKQFLQWLQSAVPLEFTAEQKQRMKDDHELKTAGLLMKLTKENRLKELREFGLYENANFRFSDAAILQVLDLADTVRQVLLKSRNEIAPEPMVILDWNWVHGMSSPEKQTRAARKKIRPPLS